MKKILFLLLLFPLSLRANILISTACSEGGSTTWTIGEIMVATLSDNNSEKSLTQGFLQPEHIVPSGIFDIPEKATQITIFPNPAKEKVFVKIDEPFTWSIYDTWENTIHRKTIGNSGRIHKRRQSYSGILYPDYYVVKRKFFYSID